MPGAPLSPPDAEGRADGLAWALFTPGDAPAAGVVVLHGADSTKESHFDFARRCRAAGLAALAFDARGHGASPGPLDGRLVADVAAMAALLRDRAGVTAVGLRGSSMGGWLALVAARGAGAGAVVAVCPASTDGLRRGLATERFAFTVDRTAADAALAGHDELAAATALACPLLLQHAEGDDVVPLAHSRAVHAAAPGSTLVVVPGGDHRSVQHDPGRQGEAIAFLQDVLG